MLEGEFGIATDDFTHTGRVIERSTFGTNCYSVLPEKINETSRNSDLV